MSNNNLIEKLLSDIHIPEEGEYRDLLKEYKMGARSHFKGKRYRNFLSIYKEKASLDDSSRSQVLKCQPCDDKVFRHVGDWVRHMQPHKGLEGVFVPDLQEYNRLYDEFKVANGMNVKYREGKWICHICGMVMRRTGQYQHLQSIHKIGVEEHTCEVCGKVSLNKYKHRRHLETHSSERNYVCPHCGKKYKNRSSLGQCARRCTGKGQFECSTCSKKFTDKQRLKYHERLHQGIRPFECPFCQLTYVRNQNLVDHVKRVHKRKLADILAEAEQTKNDNTDQDGLAFGQ